MYPGLYTAYLGMRARQQTLEVQANNIANSSTDGFKAQKLIYTTIEADRKGTGSGQQSTAAVVTSASVDFSPGALRETGSPLDLSIRGDAFFKIQTERGVRYTRSGSFTQDAAGQLITKNGDLVLGEKGAITLPRNASITIDQTGAITSNGRRIEAIKLERFENPVSALKKEGDSFFVLSGTEEPLDASQSQILQGTLESSNVSPISEMVQMINNTREFDSLQRSISIMMNDIGRKISSEIGRS